MSFRNQFVCLAASFALAHQASALTVIFHQDTSTVLNFEMANLGPTPGDQSILSPSGHWYIYAFVHQFDIGDPYAEIGLFVKRLLPIEETIGTDVIFPQIYGVPDFPLLDNEIGEFGDAYTGTFELLPGSGTNAQDWNWIMTLKTDTASESPSTVPDSSSNFAGLCLAFSLLAMTQCRQALRFAHK